MSGCKFAEGWKNQEGWLVMSNGELVCLDWDEYCTECRVDDSKDWVFRVSTNLRSPEEVRENIIERDHGVLEKLNTGSKKIRV